MLLFFLAIILLLGIFLFFYGDLGFTTTNKIVLWELRFPKIVVAFFAGGLLAAAGLLLQIFFQNPLAGPDVLGINSGASLGVAFYIMAATSQSFFVKYLNPILMAVLGSLGVFLTLTFFIQKKTNQIGLLILGLLLSSFISSFISVLINMTPSLQVKNFLMWSQGSFQGVSSQEIPFFLLLSFCATTILIFLPKKLNQLMLGEEYAKSMGMKVHSFKLILICTCSFLVALITSYCGPIGFIGIISPHVARSFLRCSDAKWILPATFLAGSFFALFSEGILIFFSQYFLTTNSILGLIGAPLIALYLYQGSKKDDFF